MERRPRRLASPAALVALCLLVGCRIGGDSTAPRDVEGDAWSAAGVDEPEFSPSAAGGVATLAARIDTSLPVDGGSAEGFDERAAQIIWRTYPGPFDTLALSVLHDGAVVHPETIHRAEDLATELGPRPAELDAGTDRRAPTVETPYPDDWKQLRSQPGPSADAELFHPLITQTARELSGVERVEIDSGEPDECFEGFSGDQPTGTFRRTSSAVVMKDDHPRSLLPGVIDYWTSLGLAVNSSPFDTGLDDVQVGFDDVGSLRASVQGDRLTLSTITACLDP